MAGITLTYLTLGREGWRDYWRRVIDFKRIRDKWYAVVFLTVPILAGLSALIDALSGGEGIRLEAATQFLNQPLMIVFFIIFVKLPF